MKIIDQTGSFSVRSRDLRGVRILGNEIVAVEKCGTAFLLGVYNRPEDAYSTLQYVMSDPNRREYRMYKEE